MSKVNYIWVYNSLVYLVQCEYLPRCQSSLIFLAFGWFGQPLTYFVSLFNQSSQVAFLEFEPLLTSVAKKTRQPAGRTVRQSSQGLRNFIKDLVERKLLSSCIALMQFHAIVAPPASYLVDGLTCLWYVQNVLAATYLYFCLIYALPPDKIQPLIQRD